MSDNKDEKKGISFQGVGGTKKMKLGFGRVMKVNPEELAPKEEPAEAVAPKAEAAEEKKPAAKKTAAKKTTAKKAEAEAEAPKAEAEEKKPAAKKTTAKKTTKKAEAEAAEAAEEKKPAAKKTTAKKTTKKAEAEDTEAVEEKKPAAKKTTAKKTTKKAEAETATEEEKKPAEEKAPEAKPETKPEPEAPAEEKAPAKKEEPKAEEPPKPAKPKLSSAVVSLGEIPARGETIRSSTVITYTGRDRKSPSRGGGYSGGYGGGRPQGGKGGYGGQGGFDKDEDSSSRTPQRRAPKPKAAAPVEEVKKSRTNYAERNAFDKKHNDSDRRDGKQSDDKRRFNRDSQFKGRVNEDGEYDEYSYKKKKKKSSEESVQIETQQITEIKIPAFITVKEFAEGIGKKSSEIIMALMKLGVMATINQELDFDTACLVADSFGINAELLEEKTEEDILFEEDTDNPENLEPRPPVVVVMGHVDHGKTSLLDKIRSTNVIEGEAGGITQKIGAYTVRLKGRQITFIDTPGHEAFTTMRARGAQFTDIAILVVAADDGVMPQTIEAINHAKAANTEIIVAINKIDKAGANPDRVKQELTNYGLICEEWGGQTIMVPISAKQGTGIDELLENVLLTADVMELKADPKGQAKGAVIEAQLDKSRGPVASVLVQRGTLKQGDTVVCGPILGNIRAMYDDKGNAIKKAGPSIPVEILGLPEVPDAGELLYAVTDDKMARQLVEKRKIKQREEQLRRSSKMSLESLAAQMAAGDVKDLNLLIKADVQGSVEAVQQSLEKLSNDEVKVKIIHGGVGAVNESDIVLADVSNAIIIGFNVRPNQNIMDKAKEAGVDIRLYSVIYNAIEDVENAMKGLLAPKIEEVVWGHAEVRQLFKVSGLGTIGGCYVTDGKILRNSSVRVIRNDVVVYTGVLGSLQHEKDSVKEAVSGHECGLTIEKYNDIKMGDIIESFGEVEVARD